VSFTADVGRPRRSSKDVEGDRLTALTEQQMSTRATPCVGYWAAYYINRDGGWSVACDGLGRIIRCETEKLALSVARYRRRRLQPLRGGNRNLACTEKRYGRDGASRAFLFSTEIREFPSLTPTSGMAYASGPSSFQTRHRGNLGSSTAGSHFAVH
jgi:hypothetical protein